MASRRLDILATGGTIASRTRKPMASGTELTEPLRDFFPGVEVVVKEVCRIGSSQITLDILRTIRSQVGSMPSRIHPKGSLSMGPQLN